MKTEAEIRKLLKYINNLAEYNFPQGPQDHYNTYTSPFPGDDGKQQVFTDEEASKILGNINLARETLQWVLEECDPYKYVENEEEARRYIDKIMYDGYGRAEIPDASPETFIECWIEDRM